MSYKFLKLALFSYFIFLYPLHAARVIIFSDIHGDIPYLTQTLTYMMAHQPTHLLANGDFVKFEQEKDLLGVFQKISEAAIQAKIPKENIFITPGNWEHTLWLSPEKVNNMLRAYGQGLLRGQSNRFSLLNGFLEGNSCRLMEVLPRTSTLWVA